MWWLLGLLIIGVLIVLVVRGRAIIRRGRLVDAAHGHLRASLIIFTRSFPAEYDDRIWSDSYLLGYISGSVATLLQFFGPGLTTEQMGLILRDVLQRLAPDRSREICDRLRSRTFAESPEFNLGCVHGSNVVGLSLNKLRPEVMAELDVQSALADAPAFEREARLLMGSEKEGDNPFAAAGGALMMTYMLRHKSLLDEKDDWTDLSNGS